MTIRRLCIPLLAAAAFAAFSGPVAAWSPEGHQVIARMAALYLTKNAKTQVEELLEQARQVSRAQITSEAPPPSPGQEED